MEQQIKWEVKYLTSPSAVRYCKKCGKKTNFIPSGLFRINAQQRYLDIWSIYQCDRCQTTWNMTVFSRINPNAISRNLLERFHSNDSALAAEYAVDVRLLKRNGAEVSFPDFEVIGEEVNIGWLLTTGARITIMSPRPTEVKLTAALRKKLGLSHRELQNLIEAGLLKAPETVNWKKCRINREVTLEVMKKE